MKNPDAGPASRTLVRKTAVSNSSFCLSFQKLDFFISQFSGFAPLQGAQGQTALAAPLQVEDRHLPGGHHPADLMVFALADGDKALTGAQGLQFCAQALGAVPQGQTRVKSRHILVTGSALVLCVVDLGDLLFRGDQPVEQVAVVGKEEQALGGLVQPTR